MSSWDDYLQAFIAVFVITDPVGRPIFFAARVSEQTMNIVTKFGGLIIATIGVQLALNGIKSFFELGG